MVAFQTMQGLYLLGFLVPLILLYMIRAKPKDITFPSIMFFASQKRQKKFNALFQKLLVRTLFFMQFFFIALLALSAANVTLTIPVDANAQNTIVVMDLSASMKTREAGITRMDLGKSDLLEGLSGRVSIVLAGDIPVLLATNVSVARAKALLTNIKPLDSETHIDSAILLANDALGGARAKILVYSDFLLSKQDDLLAAKKLAEANDKGIVFIPVGSKKANIGFVDVSFHRGTAEAFIKNFGDRNEVIDVNLDSDNAKTSTRIEIPKGGVERIAFEMPEGKSKLHFSGDSLDADNTLYLSNPSGGKVRLLYLTNEKREILLDALGANSQFDLQVAEPPVIPDFNHDIIVLGAVDKSQLLPNTLRDLKRYLDDGGRVIVAASEQSAQLDYQGLLPFNIGSILVGNQEVCVDFVTRVTSRISSPQCFTTASRLFSIELSEGKATALASSDGNPVLVQTGNLLYYGILDAHSGFKDQISYPLFWDDVISSLLGRESISNFNFKTGDVYLLPNSTVTLDTAGFSELGGNTIAVNLLSVDESNLFRNSAILNESAYSTVAIKVPLEINFAPFLLVLATLLFAAELWHIKRRGDL